MNRQDVVKRYGRLQAQMVELANELGDLESDAQDTFDERSEKWQDSEAGDNWQAMIDEIGEATAQLQELAETALP